MGKYFNKITASIISIVTIVSFFFTAYFYIDSKYALAAEVQILSERLDYKINQDKANYLQERIWRLHDRYPNQNCMPVEVKEEMRQLEKDLNNMNNYLNNVRSIDLMQRAR